MSAAEIHTDGRREQPFRIEVGDMDGDPCHHFLKDGPVEIWIVMGPAPDVAAAGQKIEDAETKMMVATLQFPNYPIARRHVDAIALVCRLLQNAIDDAREHVADAIPERDDGHRHRVRFARYTRALPLVAMCEVCMCELVPDVAGWAADRGLLGPGGEAFRINERHGTVKAAIEAAFNREPGLANG